MAIRETERIIELGSKKWKIKKFDAMTGSYIAIKILSRIAHIALGITSGQIKDKSIIVTALASEISTLSKQEFMEIQAESLNVCFLIEKVGDKEVESPIRLPDGNWAVGGVSDNVLLIMSLIAHVLLLNLSGFFDESALKESAKSFEGLISLEA